MHRGLTASPSGPLRGRISAPGDKSISHRALIMGALAVGETRIEGLLEGEDVLATAEAMRRLGARVTRDSDGLWRIVGRGIGGLASPDRPLDFGNSGTGARLTLGVLAGYHFPVSLTGDASLCERPMRRVLDPLLRMGAEVEGNPATLPFTFHGSSELVPIRYVLPTPSAQVKSAILLAGLHAPGETTVIEPAATRDHTERMLRHFGARVATAEREMGNAVTVTGDADLSGRSISIPGDPSSAAFFAAAASIVDSSDTLIENVVVNPSRIGFYETLAEMGGNLTFEGAREQSGEPVANIRVRAADLIGVDVPAARAPAMIDEYPVLAVLAAFAAGETRMSGLSELRVKESDRLASTAAGLAACGVTVRIDDDDLIVTGSRRVRGGATVRTEMDHRIAMAFLTLGLAAKAPVQIDDGSMIATSFPEFVSTMQSLGADIAVRDARAHA